MRNLTSREHELGHKLHRDSFFSSPDLYDSHVAAINCCGTVRQNLKGILETLTKKTLKSKQGEIYAKVKVTGQQ